GGWSPWRAGAGAEFSVWGGPGWGPGAGGPGPDGAWAGRDRGRLRRLCRGRGRRAAGRWGAGVPGRGGTGACQHCPPRLGRLIGRARPAWLAWFVRLAWRARLARGGPTGVVRGRPPGVACGGPTGPREAAWPAGGRLARGTRRSRTRIRKSEISPISARMGVLAQLRAEISPAGQHNTRIRAHSPENSA